jgi:cytidyltransferase-like protein
MIKKARQLADDGILIIGVSTDKLVEKYKGVKPFVPYGERLKIIQALKYPDLVVQQLKQFDVDRMQELFVDEVVLGNDWLVKMSPELQKLINHVHVCFKPLTEGVSTSDIKYRLKELQ